MYGDGDGLYLQVRHADARSWVFRYKMAGRARLMGLGSLDDVSLAEARDAAVEARKLARRGVDPIDHREAKRAEEIAARTRNTFKEVAEAYQDAHKASWRNTKHRQQWANTLTSYVYPVIGDKPVAAITVAQVMQILEPIWQTKPETAGRVRGRIETVLDYASARAWRAGDNPARWRGHLSNLLPARTKVRRVEHHAALPWAEVAAFMKTLTEQRGNAALALRFAILTAARTGEVIGAAWPEIDLQEKVWTVPAERMKAGRAHRVPLSEPAMAILTALPDREGHLFPSRRKGHGLTNMAMLVLLRRMKRSDITTHGFRSAFRDWCSEATEHAPHVAEAALAHAVGSKVEAAYRRGDLFEKRRQLMMDWAIYCYKETRRAAEVTSQNSEPQPTPLS
jgi:integrase